MLDFLVTSKARRRLLALLWGSNEQGSVASLAERAGVGFASAWRELNAMEANGLAVREVREGAGVFRANEAHPHASVLRMLVAREPPAAVPDAGRIRGQLRALGAPLQTDDVVPVENDVEEAVAEGARLARRDPSVARALPVCLYRLRDKLDPDRLRKHARAQRAKNELGFFLDLTAELSRDDRFRAWSVPLRDRRRTAHRNFFVHGARTREEQEAAAARTPPQARDWGYVMNMSLDTFRSTFEKHARR